MNKISLITLISYIFLLPLSGLGNDAEVIKYSTLIEVSEKKCLRTETLVIKINTHKGDEFTSFNIPYSNNYKIKSLTGEIRDTNAVILRKLINKDILTTSFFSYSTFYNDNYVKRFSLKHNKYPYIIQLEYQYEISPYLQIANWNPIWNIEINTQVADLTVIFPPGFQFKTNEVNIVKPQVNKTEKGDLYNWQASYTHLKANDIFAPSIFDSLPLVSIVPVNFNYIKPGSFDSWKSMGEWERAIDEGLEDLTPMEKTKIDNITSGITDPRKLVSILYHYMQDNTRYVLVDVKLGGLQPYPASYVCNNRFGDCKALANYMKALLDYKGIKSNKVDAMAGAISGKIYSGFPSQQFNHVILAVPFPNDTIWLECTSNFSPVNSLGDFTQNRLVFWIEPGNSHLINSPVLRKEEVTTVNSYHFSATDHIQKSKVKASCKLKGNLFDKVMSITKNWSEKDKKEFFNTFIAFKNYTTDQYQVIPADRDSGFVTFETSGSCNSPVQQVGEFTKVDLPSMNLPAFEKVKDRESPVNIYMPIAQIDTVCYDFNSSSIELKSEKQLLLRSVFGQLQMDLSTDKGQLKVIRKYEIPVQIIELNQYKAFYDFLNQLSDKGRSIFCKTLNDNDHEKN